MKLFGTVIKQMVDQLCTSVVSHVQCTLPFSDTAEKTDHLNADFSWKPQGLKQELTGKMAKNVFAKSDFVIMHSGSIRN